MEADELRVSKIANDLLRNIDKVITDILQSTNENSYIESLDEFTKSIEQFQPCPQLLDVSLKRMTDRLTNAYIEKVLVHNGSSELGNAIGIIFYNYAKIRGIKTISNCLKSDIYLITKVIQKLEDTSIWQERFFLLAWLSILVLAPFPLNMIGNDVSDKIYALSSYYLDYSGKENDASSILMARFLSRNDVGHFLEKFFEDNLTKAQWQKKSTFTRIGILSTTNFLLKISTYKALFKVIDKHFNLIIENLEDANDTKTMKLYLKNLGKLSILYLNAEDYEKIEEIISTFLSLLGHKDTIIRYSLAKQLSKLAINLDPDFQRELVVNIIEEFEIKELKFENTSALQLDLEVDSETINIEKFHGILLALAEFVRVRALPLDLINTIVSILNKTFFVEQHRLTFSMGSNVRDSSCFVAWALAKKYKTSEISLQSLTLLFTNLAIVACYDRDLMIRRASAACIQELVGRHGDVVLTALLGQTSKINEIKIRLIESVDYTALSQLKRSYDISIHIPVIAQGLLREQFIDHLFQKGIFSWNYDIRKQSSLTLYEFLKDSDVTNSLNDLVRRLQEIPPEKHIPNGLMYAIGTLLPLSSDFKEYESISEKLDCIKYDYHKDPYYKGEEIIYLIASMKRNCSDYEISDTQYELIFNIIRQTNEVVTTAFIELAKLIDTMPEKYNEKWIYYIKNGNIAAAKGIGYANAIVSHSFDSLMELVSNSSIDATLRSSIINSISLFVSNNNESLTSEILVQIIKNLDDYTITNQGDVGNFIRDSTISLISENINLFRSYDVEVQFEVEKRLVRLSGEIMDKIRNRSLNLLLKLKQWQHYYIEYSKEKSIEYNIDNDDDLVFDSLNDYYEFLLHIHSKEYLSKLHDEKISLISLEFWKGYSFSGGAIHATDITVNSALYSFFKSYEALSDEQRILILQKLLTIIKVDNTVNNSKRKTSDFHVDRFVKSQNSCLKFWVNLLDLNLPLPPNFNLNGLFIRVFNLHLNTSNIPRLQNAIKLFVILYLSDQTKFVKAKERLDWLSVKHPISKVRSFAKDGIAEIEWELQNKI